jgi:catechol 2,3-dioxygenase-like lactoylglutathione lyase family enzyme
MYGQLEPLSPRQELLLPAPLVRAQSLEHVTIRRREPGKTVEFLTDFGFDPSEQHNGCQYLRVQGEGPVFGLEIVPGDRDELIGFALGASAADDLERLSQETGVESVADERPGGGRRLRLTDPDGFQVDLVHGSARIRADPMREAFVSTNAPGRNIRVNRPLRTEVTPAPVVRLGHVVLQVKDLAESLAWYARHFGFLISDLQLVGDGIPVLAFARFDRGAAPTDHHSLALLAGPAGRLLHVSTETLDIDAVGQGHQYLKGRGWTHHWGLGRHVLGSQIFDYWKDPTGTEWEHYSDGDLLTSDVPTGYWKLNRASLWAWGDDLPADAVPVQAPPPDAPSYVADIYRALRAPARPWIP